MEIEDDGPPGVPEWVVTYGDMMSLLLTFFIMLVSLSEVVADQKYRAVLDALRQYVGYPMGPPSPPGKHFPLNDIVERMTKLGSFSDSDSGRGGVKTDAVRGPETRVFRSDEGRPLRVGEPLRYGENNELNADSVAALAVQITDLIGKPNKIEIRTRYEAGSRTSRDDAYARAHAMYQRLIEAEVEADRLRITLAEAPPNPDGPFQRELALDLLDTRTSDYAGPRRPMGRSPQ